MAPVRADVSNRSERLADPVRTARAIVAALETSGTFPIPQGELSIAFVSDAEIAMLHERFLGDPSPTDVITFLGDSAMAVAGEIVVSVDHAEAASRALGQSFSDELTLYLVHGWLHLAGFDDRDPKPCAAMREAEKRALAIVRDAAVAGDTFRLRRPDPA